MTTTKTVAVASFAGVFDAQHEEVVNIKESFNNAWLRCADGYSMVKDNGAWTLVDANDIQLSQAELSKLPVIREEFGVHGFTPCYAGIGTHW
jgi:hypothetical protein